ncbi:MAG: sensor histidine kinase [Chloroflexi bacterium]|nr:sensor histidine kinase [Chloroflexota bacterium]
MKNKRMLTSRFPYGLSLFAVVTIGAVHALDYFLFNGNLTAAEPHWKKWVLFSGYFILALFDLFDMIFMSRKRQFMSTLFFILRVILIGFMQNLDVTNFSRILFGLVPYHAYLIFGLVVSLLSSVVVLYYFYTYAAFIPTPTTLPSLASVLFFQLAAIFAERDKKATFQNQEIIEELSRSNIELRTYIEDLSRLSIMEERVQLSNDLHDSIGHYLVAINIQLEKAMAYRSISTETMDEAILNAKYSVEQALREVRRFVDGLHDKEDVYSIKEKAEELIKNFKSDFKQVDFNYQGNEFGYARIIRRNLFYILQESLTNVQKHAHAENVHIDLNFKAREVTLLVKDDGVGFKLPKTSDQAGHYGLESIRQRVELLSGTVNIQSNRKKGTSIDIRIPKKQDEL